MFDGKPATAASVHRHDNEEWRGKRSGLPYNIKYSTLVYSTGAILLPLFKIKSNSDVEVVPEAQWWAIPSNLQVDSAGPLKMINEENAGPVLRIVGYNMLH